MVAFSKKQNIAYNFVFVFFVRTKMIIMSLYSNCGQMGAIGALPLSLSDFRLDDTDQWPLWKIKKKRNSQTNKKFQLDQYFKSMCNKQQPKPNCHFFFDKTKRWKISGDFPENVHFYSIDIEEVRQLIMPYEYCVNWTIDKFRIITFR